MMLVVSPILSFVMDRAVPGKQFRGIVLIFCAILVLPMFGCQSSPPPPAHPNPPPPAQLNPPPPPVPTKPGPTHKPPPTPSNPYKHQPQRPLPRPLPSPALPYSPVPQSPGSPSAPDPTTEILKHDCQTLVSGQLAFNPEATMRQGKSAVISARLSRGTDVTITQGMKSGVVIQNTQVSCLASVSLSSQENDAFTIDRIPEGRSDEQVLRPNQFAQWDWRVTPLKAGTLHLLLYVTPVLYIDGVGRGLEQFPQTPRIITVTPDHIYATVQFVKTYWLAFSTLVTVIVIPLIVWSYRKWAEWHAAGKEKKKTVGFAPRK